MADKERKRVAYRLPPERLMKVDQMLRACWTHGRIQVALSKEWNLSQRQIRNYIQAVYRKWEEDAEKTLVDRVWLRRSQLEGLLEEAMNPDKGPPDIKAASQVMNLLCKVDGAFSPDRVEHSGNIGNDVKSMTSADKRKELDELLETYAALGGLDTNRPANGGGGSTTH